MKKLIGWALALVVLALYAGNSDAQTVGVNLYSHHTNEGKLIQCLDGPCPGVYQRHTLGLYARHEGWVGGVYCNSYSVPQYNYNNPIQQRSCNVTYHFGRAWTLAEGPGWDVSASLEAAVGYKRNAELRLHLGKVADISPLAALSVRLGPVRIAAAGPYVWHVSTEQKL